MPNQQLQMAILSLKAQLATSQGLISSAQGQAGIPVLPNTPVVGLNTLAQAVSAQQKALEQIQKILEKMA